MPNRLGFYHSAMDGLDQRVQIIADGHGYEAWRTMPLEREKLYSIIKEIGAANTVILSGDRHLGLYRQTISLKIALSEVTSSSTEFAVALWHPDKDRVEETDPYKGRKFVRKSKFWHVGY